MSVRSNSAATTKKGAKSHTLDPDVRRGQWLKGVLELCLLGVLQHGEAYGYELGQRLEEAGLGAIKGGTLYPRLAALESAGMIEAHWREGDGGPGRKYYRLTDLGRSTLLGAAEEYERFTTVAQTLIRGENGASSESSNSEDDQNTTGVSSGPSN